MLERIKKEILEARKSKDSVKANLLNTLYSEAKTIAINNGRREPNETELMDVLKKFIKGNKETVELKKQNSIDCMQDEKEKEILESFQPKQLNDNELEIIIKSYISELEDKSKKSMGIIMKKLKQNHDGSYDGKKASNIINKLL
ncbi:MAG: GatB/YqeY domain-containing protein [Candidatus Muirbacterium halophilum]|nr:GatB/YqeY domain-containing protein [Candidatus Muirbacterium halophilum]MCK9476727.1 GatB/YqeY domain-containing protein [Candidatus Muirbacterium halophilum]